MNLGMEKNHFAQDLVDSGRKLDGEVPVALTTTGEQEHRIGEDILEITGEPASGQLRSTTVAESQFQLQNPCVQ